MKGSPSLPEVDVVLAGAGIMSATLGIFLKKLNPELKIEIFEALDRVAIESSNAWNNAGTGHAAFCELNYTPQKSDNSVDASKALDINESFDVSRQFWAWLVEQGVIEDAEAFIQPVPHLSFVKGKADVAFLKKRWEALVEHAGFEGMEYTEDPKTIQEWIPLVMEGRKGKGPVAATKIDGGTDVNFGSLTRQIFAYLEKQPGVKLHTSHNVKDLERAKNGKWVVTVQDKKGKKKRQYEAGFVFLGAGGGALPLLQKSDIPEGKGFGGFPVSGQWLRCDNPQVVNRHFAKVYGKASVGTPPMSVPHLDTRVIDGQKSLLFGPYAGFTTKYLKNGSLLDLPFSFRPNNLVPMIAAGLDNVPLTQYLIGQVVQSPDARLSALREYMPDAKAEDWYFEEAGQRVQIIKKDKKKGGVLQFGTEVVSAKDGSIAALLGASPGASTAVSIMISLMKKCFPKKMESTEWKKKFKEMIPSYGQSLKENPSLLREQRVRTDHILKLKR